MGFCFFILKAYIFVYSKNYNIGWNNFVKYSFSYKGAKYLNHGINHCLHERFENKIKEFKIWDLGLGFLIIATILFRHSYCLIYSKKKREKKKTETDEIVKCVMLLHILPSALNTYKHTHSSAFIAFPIICLSSSHTMGGFCSNLTTYKKLWLHILILLLSHGSSCQREHPNLRLPEFLWRCI